MSGDCLCHTALMRSDTSQGGGGRTGERQESDGGQRNGWCCADTVTPAEDDLGIGRKGEEEEEEEEADGVGRGCNAVRRARRGRI